MALLVDVAPHFAIKGCLIEPATGWSLFTEQPGGGTGQARIVREAQFAEGGDVLQQIGGIADGEAELEP